MEFVYPDRQSEYVSISRAILSGTNLRIDELNALILSRIPGKEFTLYSADKCEDDSHNPLDVSTEVLGLCDDVGVPKHELILKPGAVAMIIRNLTFGVPLVNSMKVSTSPETLLIPSCR